MAAIFKLRRGTSIPSLVESEPFYKTDSDSFHIGDGSTYITLVKIGSNTGSIDLLGDIDVIGGISGSTLDITGNAKIDGNLTLGGGFIKLGDSGSDEIEFVGVLSGSLIPESDALYDIGSSNSRYKKLYAVSASIEDITLGGTRILSSSQGTFQDFDTFSSSLDSRILVINTFTSSQETKNTTLQTVTSSFDSRLNNIESFSSSQETKDTTLETVTASFDDRISQLETDSGSQASRLDNIETTTASFDDRISQLESDTGSQDSRLDNLETYTSSNDDNITELFASASDHESRIDVIETTFSSSVDLRLDNAEWTGSNHENRLDELETTFSSSVDSRLDYLEGDFSSSVDSRFDYLEGDFSSSVDDRLDQLSIETGSIETEQSIQDSRLDNIENVTGSYATTGSNLFIGDQTITGSIEGSGSVRFRGIPWPETGSEHHLFKTDPFILNLDTGDRNYGYLGVNLSHYENNPGYFHNSFNIYVYDDHDNPSYGSEFNVGPLRNHMQVLASGSGNLANISIQDVKDGTTLGLLYADDIQLGVYTGSSIQIGNNTTVTTFKGAIVNYLSDISSSGYISASVFVGDGEQLSNVTASYVDYNNIDGKPTLVSQSSQIDVNDTQNFTPFSTSVDLRLDTIEGDLSSSIDSQLDNIHLYTSSLKTAFDVSDTNVTIFGDLTVQGETTTLNTSELNIEDKTITIGSGSATSAEADGAGIIIDGAGASIIWDHTNSLLNVNTKISSSTGFAGDGADITNIDWQNIVFGGSDIVSESYQVNFTELSGISANIISASSDTDRVTITISGGSISADLIGGVVSGSDQVSQSLDNRYLKVLGDSVVSGSSQISASQTDNWSTDVKTELDSNNVISGSIQVQYGDISSLPTDIVSASNDTSTVSFSIQNGIISASVIGNVVSGSDQVTESLDLRYVNEVDYVIYTSSVEDRTSNLEATGSDHEGRINELETTFSSSVDSRLDYLEGDFSSSLDTRLDYLEGDFSTSVDERLDDTEWTGSNHESRIDELETTFSSSVDTRLDYLEGDFSTSVDNRLDSLELDTHTHSNKSNLDTINQNLATTNSPSFAGLSLTSVLPQPSGSIEFNALFLSSSNEFTYRTLGDAVLYSVTSSEEIALVSGSISYTSDNLLTAGAVKKYVDWRTEEILAAIGAADITSVTVEPGSGLSGGGLAGDVSLSLDSGSDAFKLAVYEVLGAGVLSSSNETFSEFSQSVASDFAGLSTDYNDLQNIPAGIISGAEQLLDVATDFGTGRVSGDDIGNLDGTTTFTGSFVGDGTQLSGVTSYTDADTLDYINSLEVISGSSQLDGTTIGGTSPSVFSGSFSGSFVGDGTQLSGVTSYTDADTLDYINSINVVSGSEQILGGSGILSASNENFTDFSQSVDSRLDSAEGALASGNDRLNALEAETGSISTEQSIQDDRLSQLEAETGSISTEQSIQDDRLSQIENVTSSLDETYEEKSSATHTLVSGSSQIVYGDISSLPSNIVSQSTDSNNIDFTITNGNITANLKGGVVSGSDQVTQSLDSRYLNLSGGESVSGNTTFQDITVNGTGSFAYIQSTTGSAKVIGDAFIIVNSDTPTQRYAGLSVYDSGSTQSSASFFFDSQLNDWQYEYSGSAGIDYAVTIFGPEFSTKGNPTYLTDNTIPKALDNHHIVDSNISDDGTTISLGSDVNVTGSIVVSGTVDGIDLQSFSSSADSRLDSLEAASNESPLTFNDTTNVDLIRIGDVVTANLKGGVVSGSSQVNFTQLSGISPNIISASSDTAQVDMIINGGSISANLKGGVVSGSFGGDVTGTIGTLTVGKVQGVAITSGEATQLSNIDTTTISTTQWGYLGALNQGLTTTSTVQFGKVGVGGASDATYELKVTGDIGATGDIVAYVSSDERLKDEITPIDNPLDKINQIGGYSFVWNDNQDIYKGKDYGVIAQEIESILPELVENRDNGYKAVKYDRLVSLLIEGIKDLHSEVQELKQKLKD